MELGIINNLCDICMALGPSGWLEPMLVIDVNCTCKHFRLQPEWIQGMFNDLWTKSEYCFDMKNGCFLKVSNSFYSHNTRSAQYITSMQCSQLSNR